MQSLTIRSPAKVNLCLRVLGRRRDGYHDIVTLFHRISLSDRLVLQKTDRPGLTLRTNHNKLRAVKRNLIYAAYQELKRAARWKGGVRVTLTKKIPIEAGLGGGSSNAAHFLLGMNQLFELGLPQRTLVRIGARLGADIPFFIHNCTHALGVGRGEIVKPLPLRHRLWFALLPVSFGVSTRKAYQLVSHGAHRLRGGPKRSKDPGFRGLLTRISRDATMTSNFFRDPTRKQSLGLLQNDLYPASCILEPKIKQLDALFGQLGLTRRAMSGSGPTLFSIHRARREAELACRMIRRVRRGAAPLVCRSF